MSRTVLCTVAVLATALITGASTHQPSAAIPPTLSETLAGHAESMREHVRTNPARAFLDALPSLPSVRAGRVVRYDAETTEAITEAAYRALDEDDPDRERFAALNIDNNLYYTSLFGTPALYARCLDLASAHGITTFDETRILDFGFGQVGHLRTLASLGARCVGIEVSSLVEAMYSEPEDTGLIPRHDPEHPGPLGTLRLVYGSWPGDRDVANAVGGRYDLIISKNVLKKGYIHPEREADPSQLIDLGVDDEVFIKALHDALVPGGLMMIYNFSPKPAPEGEPFKPWSDGRCPFTEQQWRDAGFEVLAHDIDDTDQAIDHFMGATGRTRDELEGNLFGTYTIVRRPQESD